ncbi:MAG: hypothetical protein IPN51_03395, partial [Chloracidobacterium sp.]|nr:hypothetical protein [Chloracidobacterium sp.]
TADTGIYGDLAILPATYSITASAAGFRSQTVLVTALDGENVVRNFILQPIPVIENTALQVASESCGVNSTPEPGETVTVDLPLLNTGLLNTQNLTAALLATGSITNTSETQNYGTLTVGGSPVARPFSFTVAATVTCGSEILLNFQLQDGTNDLGS